nr:class I SAM-dependent methyltransferase [Bacillus sp. OV322]
MKMDITDNVISYYSNYDEWGRLDREPLEFQVNWHYIKKHLLKKGRVLDNGAGPGKYALKLAGEGYRVTLTDLTPKMVETAQEKAKEQNVLHQFEGFYARDARQLTGLPENTYHASLMLGPLYHLQKEQDRIQAVRELHRVTKKDGIVFVACMSRVRHLITSLQNPLSWKPNHTMDSINEFNSTGLFNHADSGRFTGVYYFELEEIKPFMESNGFQTLELIGSNVGAALSQESWNYWEQAGQEELSKVRRLIVEKASDPYILGISSHLLYIGKKC